MNQIEHHPESISGQIKRKLLELHFEILWLLATLVTILDYEKNEVITRYGRVYKHQPDFPTFFIFGYDQNETECTFNN